MLDKYPAVDTPACEIDIVLSDDKSPPPVSGAVVDIKRVEESLLLNVIQSVFDKYPEDADPACKIDIVRLADRSPPPVSGEVVDIERVGETLALNAVQSVPERAPLVPDAAVGIFKVIIPDVVIVGFVKLISLPAEPTCIPTDVTLPPDKVEIVPSG